MKENVMFKSVIAERIGRRGGCRSAYAQHPIVITSRIGQVKKGSRKRGSDTPVISVRREELEILLPTLQETDNRADVLVDVKEGLAAIVPDSRGYRISEIDHDPNWTRGCVRLPSNQDVVPVPRGLDGRRSVIVIPADHIVTMEPDRIVFRIPQSNVRSVRFAE